MVRPGQPDQSLASQRGFDVQRKLTELAANHRLREVALYLAVSVAALVPDVGLFAVLTAFNVMPSHFAGSVSYLCGMGFHYLLATRFVFNVAATRKSHRRLIAEYLVTGLVGVCVTALTIYTLVQGLGLHPLAAKAAGILASFVTVYVLRSTVVFKKHNPPAEVAVPTEDLHATARQMRAALRGRDSEPADHRRKAG